MRVDHRLAAIELVPVEEQPDPVDLGNGVRAEWEVNDNAVAAVHLILTGVTLKRGASGSITTNTDEIKSKTFYAINLIANNVLFQTGVDAFAPSKVIKGYPNDMGNYPSSIDPETDDEKKELNRDNRRTVGNSLPTSWRILGKFDSSMYLARVAHSAGLANYADGIRAESPFVKYEQFYKVIEHFFPDPNRRHGGALQGNELDRAVSAHMVRIDSRFTQSKVKKLREVRIRSMHAHPYNTVGSHLSPQNMQDTQTLVQALPDLQDLARLLLERPPSP